MRPNDSYQYEPSSSRCAANGKSGRCQLRGTIGSAGPNGGHWLCSWHYETEVFGKFPSYENFTNFIHEQQEAGVERWNHRSIADWWNLVQGNNGAGSFDLRKREDVVAASQTREVTEY